MGQAQLKEKKVDAATNFINNNTYIHTCVYYNNNQLLLISRSKCRSSQNHTTLVAKAQELNYNIPKSKIVG